MSLFPHRLPNRIVRDADLKVADKLFLLHCLTWKRRFRDESGREQKAATEFTGWNSRYAIQQLGISKHRPYSRIIATLDYVKVHEIPYRGRMHLQITLSNPIGDMSYFYCQQEVFDLDITPSEKLGLIIAFMLRDQSSYQLRSERSFIDELGRCLHLQQRQCKRVKQSLVEHGFLQETSQPGKPSLFELLPHKSFALGWESLVKAEPEPKNAAMIPNLRVVTAKAV
jgi:hypothetical protein